MAPYRSSRTFPYVVRDLRPVAQDVMDHFKEQSYEVAGDTTPQGGWQISVRKGGFFRTVAGQRTALNIRIEAAGNETTAEASIGIFGSQAVPTAITMLVTWPFVVFQIWGLAQNLGLDKEALAVVGRSLSMHSDLARWEREDQPSPPIEGNADEDWVPPPVEANAAEDWVPPEERT